MKEHNLIKIVGQAIQDYCMIEDGNVVWVGISGAVKSLVALVLLTKRLSFVPVTYTLQPIHILTPGEDEEAFRSWYAGLEKRFSLPPLVVSSLPREGYALYSSFPRKAVIQALIHVCGQRPAKLVLGDSLEDITLSALAALFYHHRWAPLLPHMPLTRYPLSFLRPLAYLSHRQLNMYTKQYGIDPFRLSSPLSNGKTHLSCLIDSFHPCVSHPLRQVFAAFRNPKKDYFLQFPL